PGVRLVDVAGRLRVVGDSMDVQLARVRLPASALRDARGTVRWPHGTLLFDLRLRADSATLGDLQFIDRRFAGVPAAGVVSGDVRLRSHGERVLEVGLDPLRLEYGGGTVAGRLNAFSASDSGLVALRDADLDAREFDLEFARPFLDTLPFAGRLSGHTTAAGTRTGTLRAAQFAGTLEHRDGERPPSALTGSVRLDTRGEVLGIYADVTADSLSFDDLRGSFPTLPLLGAAAGSVKLAGPLGALETHVDLHSGGGAVRGDGTLMLDLPHYGARGLTVTARDLDLAHWLGRRAPP